MKRKCSSTMLHSEPLLSMSKKHCNLEKLMYRLGRQSLMKMLKIEKKLFKIIRKFKLSLLNNFKNIKILYLQNNSKISKSKHGVCNFSKNRLYIKSQSKYIKILIMICDYLIFTQIKKWNKYNIKIINHPI